MFTAKRAAFDIDSAVISDTMHMGLDNTGVTLSKRQSTSVARQRLRRAQVLNICGYLMCAMADRSTPGVVWGA